MRILGKRLREGETEYLDAKRYQEKAKAPGVEELKKTRAVTGRGAGGSCSRRLTT